MKFWVFAVASIFLVSSAQAQDYEREERWAAEVIPNVVVGDVVRIKLPSGREFLGLHADNKTARRAILLVHGLGVHPDHGVIGILRAAFADLGYNTLSIQMPVLASDAAADEYPKLFPEAAARIQAGADWLAAKGFARPILLSHSMGSRMADAYFARAGGASFSAWVSLGIPGGFAGKAGIPLLDVYGENDFPQVLDAAARRRTRQLRVAGADHYYTGREAELANAIATYLDRQSSDN
jgi:pimeloyl-ACP methyl ester carboxylesterase